MSILWKVREERSTVVFYGKQSPEAESRRGEMELCADCVAFYRRKRQPMFSQEGGGTECT